MKTPIEQILEYIKVIQDNFQFDPGFTKEGILHTLEEAAKRLLVEEEKELKQAHREGMYYVLRQDGENIDDNQSELYFKETYDGTDN